MASSRHFWTLHPDREPTLWSGRYLVVMDSNRATLDFEFEALQLAAVFPMCLLTAK
jgi:hypothetical protein